MTDPVVQQGAERESVHCHPTSMLYPKLTGQVGRSLQAGSFDIVAPAGW